MATDIRAAEEEFRALAAKCEETPFSWSLEDEDKLTEMASGLRRLYDRGEVPEADRAVLPMHGFAA